MKNLKTKFLSTIALLFCLYATAQNFNSKAIPANSVGPTRGTYGTAQPFNYQTGSLFTIVTNTVTAVPSGTIDTLTSPPTAYTGYKTDSAFLQFYFPSKVDAIFDLSIARISGTIAGTAVLQGSFDNSNWHALTSTTTTCTQCVVATATITGTGTTHYQWNMRAEQMIYPYYQIPVILTGTCSATASGIAGYKY